MLLAFDIDGTLIYFSSVEETHHGSLAEAVKEVTGREIRIEKIPGYTDYMLIKNALLKAGHGITEVDFRKLFKIAGKLFEKKLLTPPKVIEGVKDFLTALKESGHELILITGNLERIAKHKLKLARLWNFFSGGVFGDTIAEDRESLGKVALKKFGRIDWVFGDTPLDISLARAIGAKIAVITTSYPKEVLLKYKPDLVFESYSDPRLWASFES